MDSQITELLQAWGAGDKAAVDRVTSAVYAELHRLAKIYASREKAGNSLQATALVNEAYLRLVDMSRVSWKDRAHFFAIAANTMRRILVDAARAKVADKRGGGEVRMEIHDSIDASPMRPDQIIGLDDALEALAKRDARKARVVELRFFVGLTAEETA